MGRHRHAVRITGRRALCSMCATRIAVERLVGELGPAAVVHTAYLQSGPDMADVNVAGSANVARAAAAAGARLIHLSTDFVFDGEKDGAYREDDEPVPVTPLRRVEAGGRAGGRWRSTRPPCSCARRCSTPARSPGRTSGWSPTAIAGRRRCRLLHGRAAVPDRGRRSRRRAARAAWAATVRGPLHVAGSETVSRYRFAALVAEAAGLDRDRLRPALSAELARARGRATARSTARGRRPCWRPGCAARPRCSERPTGRSTLGANGDGRKLAGADPLGGGVRTRFPDRRTGHAGAALAGGDHRRPGAADRLRAGLSALADLRGEPAGAVRLVPRRRSSSRTA